MDKDVAIKVENVSKKYCLSLKRSMLYGIKDIARNTLGLSSYPGILRKDEFWAIDDVSFELKKGEVLGLIGKNGSGKSTLLKMLNGIFMPDKGKIEIKGKVGALIEVGAGFHPLLTGRENIYVNGAILGMSKKEIDEKFDDIVAFADIGDFLDSPVKNYSSGMYVRLGFAVAIHCEPEVLLVDEVLAVGDFNFQRKCFEKISELEKRERGIIIVSHNLIQIEAICDRCIFMNKGKIEIDGSPKIAIAEYLNYENFNYEKKEIRLPGAIGTGDVVIMGIRLLNKQGEEIDTYFPNEDITISINFFAKKRIYKPNFVITINMFNDFRIFSFNSKVDDTSPERVEGNGKIECIIKTIPLLPNIYGIDVFIKDDEYGIFFDAKKNVKNLIVKVPIDSNLPYRASGDMGIIAISCEWKFN